MPPGPRYEHFRRINGAGWIIGIAKKNEADPAQLALDFLERRRELSAGLRVPSTNLAAAKARRAGVLAVSRAKNQHALPVPDECQSGQPNQFRDAVAYQDFFRTQGVLRCQSVAQFAVIG